MTKPADSDQIARRWLQKTFNSTGPNHQFSFDEDGMVELVLKPFAASERQAVIEDCCRAACGWCYQGYPAELDENELWCHPKVCLTGVACKAAAIRSME